jgi:hypothetical protein
VGFLQRLLRPDPAASARLEHAAAAVDRELAANIELSAMFDQTHQAVIFENGEFTRHASALEAAPAAFPLIADVYRRIPPTEDAMERRGPANSLRPDDKVLIETWEGDAREAQRALRAALAAPPPSGWALLLARLRGGRQTRR